ncbi:MAG: ribbon-helix-helix protein, CopG family [Actinomycetota bacterium]|nr:ribbon-helix-helix protein, CopG family [Actinomycetota bacterium]MDI6821662.1 ribbon-helix-helix protein, CopG family [Actinomycetota bacterium]
MGRVTKTLTISLPPQVFEEVERLAKQERKTKSELFRDMISVYEDYLDEKRWRRLRRLGRETAKRLNITSEEDIEKLVHEARGIRS